jgi:hypothetical protein
MRRLILLDISKAVREGPPSKQMMFEELLDISDDGANDFRTPERNINDVG